MKKEIRTVVYDEALNIEACRFEGIAQPFPNHFHEYYVIGYIERGSRLLSCKNRDYRIGAGSVILFHPGDNHACVQTDEEDIDYCSFHIGAETMAGLALEITGERRLPGFAGNVICDDGILCALRRLHELVMCGSEDFGKEETLLLLISGLMQKYGQPFACAIPECREEIGRACAYMERHFSEHISLDQICREAGLSRSTLLRAFTKEKGITPYRYLETIRVSEAKKLLADGASVLDAAIGTGFCDQSHFTNYFSRFIGVAPGVYREIFSEKNREKEASDRRRQERAHKKGGERDGSER